MLASIIMSSSLLLLLAVTAPVSAFQAGDSCGVQSRDFLSYEFLGQARVAGETGCESEDGQQDCFCAPVLNNDERLSEWQWQCGDTVQFGPKNDKTCPEFIPVPKPHGISVGFVESQLALPVPCDTALNPTGYFNDEVCGYNECENNLSAVCGCVDLDARGVENGGTVWICLHSTCSCDDVETTTSWGNTVSIAVAGTVAAAAMMV